MSRIVVVGNGMAAVRLVEGLVARGASGITVLGEEQEAPYNRILLSAVLEGTHRPDAITLRSERWYADNGVDLRLGTRVVDVHREEREVELADRSRVPYDHLVLATGSIPTLPPIRGLVRPEGALHEKVHAFRSLADCTRLLGAVRSRQARSAETRAVVVGGGLLGLQVARALSIRGVATEIVEGGEHLLRSHVDEQAGRILRRSLTRLGTTVYTGARAVRLTEEGLRLDNGFTLDTDLVVLTAGGRPSINLARRCGISTRRGVVVDATLASVDDERIHAIGDCAETVLDEGTGEGTGERIGRTTGFVPPAWEQANVLAARLTGTPLRYEGHKLIARLRATGLDVAVLGDPAEVVGAADGLDGDVVQVANPVTGSLRRLVVRDGVIVAATLIGDLSRIGLITQAYDRGTVLGPNEPGQLLMGLARPAGGDDAVRNLPDDAEVCACAGVSAGRIRGCSSLEDVRERTRATTGCGGCASTVKALLGASVGV
jgi:assimilatory nitrate reductase electron transfer subunit